MLLLIIRILYAVICGGAIAAYLGTDQASLPLFAQKHSLFTFFTMLLVSQSVTVIDILIKRKRIELITSIYFGLLIGVLLYFACLVGSL